jgi:hypothetical protein
MPADGGESMPMTGYLSIHKKVFDLLPGLQDVAIKRGIRVGAIPVLLHNEQAFLKTDNVGRTVISLKTTTPDSEDLVDGDVSRLLELLRDDRGNAENELVRLSVMGRKIFGHDDAGDNKQGEEETDQTEATEVIYRLPVAMACSFIEDNGGAIVFDVQDDGFGQLHADAATMCHTRNKIMHVTVGDMDLDNQLIYSWSADFISATTTKMNLKRACELFGQLPVYAYTPDVNVSNHVFGKRELKAVYMNPLLYVSKDLTENLNKQLQTLSTLRATDATAQPLFELIKSRLLIASNKAAIFKDYVNSGYDTDLEKKLLSIEYHPFVDFVATMGDSATKPILGHTIWIYPLTLCPPQCISCAVICSWGT